MKLSFIKASPSKNMTAFITNKVAKEDYVRVANYLMTDEYVSAEQVGFLVEPNSQDAILRLEMSGGEFCGNGLLSAAAYCSYEQLTPETSFYLEISGVDHLLRCEVECRDDGSYVAKGEMPKDYILESLTINFNGEEIVGTVVKLSGISHFITDYTLNEESYDSLLDLILEKIDDKAVGIIPYDQKGHNQFSMKPFVWVKESGTKVFERSCGSGSYALALLMKEAKNLSTLHIEQPGGIVTTEIGEKNSIATSVFFPCEGTITILPT
ncbi:MAG TPA: hypothetical protein VK125_08000 [Bacillota bacterium]|nr:hypothetical protein [Bacillota bacterium]